MKKKYLNFNVNFWITLWVFTLLTGCDSPKSSNSEQKLYNVVFIAVDDLRPNLGCYEDSFAITPNIDQIASKGTVFSRAYCQQAVCAPSRASIMTGLRPDQTGVWNLVTHFRENIPEVVTLPQFFKKQGYHSLSVGKIFHDPKKGKDPQSWSVESRLDVTQNGQGHKYVLEENYASKTKGAATEMVNVPDSAYIDGKVSQVAIELLNKIKDSTFFLAVGFRRPHLPFSAPEKYWNLYNSEEIPEITNPAPPKGVPEIALHNWKELRGYTDMPKIGDVDPEKAKKLRWGYYAAISYVDAQIGKLINELKRLNLDKNTVIVLWSDHGYHLGEKNLWCKITNFELDTRVPLIISLPNQKAIGAKTNAIVELVDVYPTLADVCGFDIPEELAGKSLKPLLENPNTIWKNSALSQFPRPGYYKDKPNLMGYSIRTDQFRYTKWINIQTGNAEAIELYDHFVDPGEEVNIAEEDKMKGIIDDLDKIFEDKISKGYKNVVDKFRIK